MSRSYTSSPPSASMACSFAFSDNLYLIQRDIYNGLITMGIHTLEVFKLGTNMVYTQHSSMEQTWHSGKKVSLI
jgi:hypothetical protein